MPTILRPHHQRMAEVYLAPTLTEAMILRAHLLKLNVDHFPHSALWLSPTTKHADSTLHQLGLFYGTVCWLRNGSEAIWRNEQNEVTIRLRVIALPEMHVLRGMTYDQIFCPFALLVDREFNPPFSYTRSISYMPETSWP